MGDIGPVDVDFALKNLNFEEEISKMKAQIAGLTTSVQKEATSTSNVINKMGAALATYFGARQIGQFASDIIQARGNMQQLQVSLETMLKSKSEANTLMAQMVDLAAKTPFELKDVSQGGKQLLAYGTDARDVTSTLKMLGDIAAGTSTPLNDLVYLYGTSQTQGRLYTRDIMQFAGRGIPLIAELSKQFGISKSQVMEFAAQGRIGFSSLQKALESMVGSGGIFGGLMERQNKTITGQLSNLKDIWYQAMNEMGKDSEGLINTAISGGQGLIAHWKDIAKILATLVTTYGSYKAAVMTVTVIEGIAAEAAKGYTLAETLQYNAALLAEKAQKILNATMLSNPYVAVATAIAAVTTALILFHNKQDVISKTQEKVNEIDKEYSDNLGVEQQNLKLAFDTLQRTQPLSEARRKVIEDLNKNYKEYLPNMDLEKASLGELAKAYNLTVAAMEKQLVAKRNAAKVDIILNKRQDVADMVDKLNKEIKEAETEVEDNNKSSLTPGQNLAATSLWIAHAKKQLADYKIQMTELDTMAKRLTIINTPQTRTKTDDDSATKGKKQKKQKTELEIYEDYLNKEKKAYEDYENAKAIYGTKKADELYAKLRQKGVDYTNFLLNEAVKQGKTNNAGKIGAIATAAAGAGSDTLASITETWDWMKGNPTQLKPLNSLPGMAKNDGFDQQVYDYKRKIWTTVDELNKYTQDHTLATNDKIKESAKDVGQMSINELDKYIKELRQEQSVLDPMSEDFAAKQNEINQAMEAKTNKIRNNMQDVSSIFGSLSQAIGDSNSELSNMLASVSQMANYAGQLLTDFSSGNYLGAIADTVNVMSTFIAGFDKQSINYQEWEQKSEEYVSKMNELIQLQTDTLDELTGTSKVSGRNEALKQLKDDLTDIGKKAQENVKFWNTDHFFRLNGATDIPMDELIKIRDEYLQGITKTKYGLLDEEQFNVLDEYVNQYEEAQKKIVEITNETNAELTGTTYDTIVSNLKDAFSDGILTTEEFASNFKKIMQDAVMNAFERQYLDEQLQTWYDSFAADMESGGQLTADEVAALKASYQTITDNAQAGIDQLKNIAGITLDSTSSSTDSNSLSGAVKGVSQETASLIAGQMNAVRINQAEMLKRTDQALNSLAQITINTGIIKDIYDLLKSDPLRAKGV